MIATILIIITEFVRIINIQFFIICDGDNEDYDDCLQHAAAPGPASHVAGFATPPPRCIWPSLIINIDDQHLG